MIKINEVGTAMMPCHEQQYLRMVLQFTPLADDTYRTGKVLVPVHEVYIVVIGDEGFNVVKPCR